MGVEYNDPQQGEPAEDVDFGDVFGRPDRAELGRRMGPMAQSPRSLSCGTSAPMAGEPAHQVHIRLKRCLRHQYED